MRPHQGPATRPTWRRTAALLIIGAAFASAPAAGAGAPVLPYAPPCRYTTSPDTVLDNDTWLTWQRAVDPGLYAWSAAAAYCQGLTLVGGGWRLPTIQEIQTLDDELYFDPAIDWTAFPNTTNDVFWSSSPDATDPGFAWSLYTRFGNVRVEIVTTPARVRCVR